MKGTLNTIFQRLGLDLDFTAGTEEGIFSEGLNIASDAENLGFFGVLKKSICAPFGIDQEVLFADLDWDSILDKTAENHRLSLKEVSKYPSIRRDFALLIDKTVNFSQIEEIAYTSEKK